MPDDLATIEQRLDAGDWLLPGEVATLLGVGRTTMHRMLNDGTIAYRLQGGGTWRRCDPDDVRRVLAESRRTLRGANHQPSPDSGSAASPPKRSRKPRQ